MQSPWPDPKWLQKLLELLKHDILTLPLGQHFPGMVVYRVPKPSFVTNKTPHFIQFHLITACYKYLYF